MAGLAGGFDKRQIPAATIGHDQWIGDCQFSAGHANLGEPARAVMNGHGKGPVCSSEKVWHGVHGFGTTGRILSWLVASGGAARLLVEAERVPFQLQTMESDTGLNLHVQQASWPKVARGAMLVADGRHCLVFPRL